MVNSLFESVKSLYYKINDENLDIHRIQEELDKIVAVGRNNSRLRIITKFILVLEVVVRNYEYEDVQVIAEIKNLVKRSLELLLFMVEGKYSNEEGASKIDLLIKESREYLVKKVKLDPFFIDKNLLTQFAYDLKKDIENIESLFLTPMLLSKEKHYYNTVKYYMHKISDSCVFINMVPVVDFTNTFLKFIDERYHNHEFIDLRLDKTYVHAIDYYKKIAGMITDNINNIDSIKHRLINQDHKLTDITHTPKEHQASVINNSISTGVVLTDEEVSALMSDDYGVEVISFDESESMKDTSESSFSEKIHSNEKRSLIHDEEYYNLMKKNLKTIQSKSSDITIELPTDQEEILMKYLGRLFQKQEYILSGLAEEKLVEMKDDISEISLLTNNIKHLLFDHYYISIKDLLGADLREYINTEVKNLGKRIRLGIQGENMEILSRMSEFVKHVVFTLVKHSIHYSLEPVFRRRAVDKNETAWLLIEFKESEKFLDIYIKDDGRGIISEDLNIVEFEEQIKEKGGSISINAVEHEYLKIHVQLPMKKIISDCLVVQLGDTKLLIPSRCVDRVVDKKDLAIALKDERCLGHINLSVLLGLEPSLVHMFVVCEFQSGKKILFGVDNVLYNMEALIETVDMPLIQGADCVSILKDGSLGFVLNEKVLENLSDTLLKKRKKSVSVTL